MVTLDNLLEKIKTNPEIINGDGILNIEKLTNLLGQENTTSNNQGYELTFAGKGLARAKKDAPTQKELKVETAQSKNFDTTNNVIIRGDNLDCLKILKQNYSNSIKMIYIDPPYNTKSDNFIYNDDLRKSEEELINELGIGEDTINYLQNIYGTQSHSGWLSFMYPRLVLARDLLRDDGVIFISIDDNEQANLKLLCDEVFGNSNMIGNMIWLKKNAQNDADNMQKNHEYILVYQKEQAELVIGGSVVKKVFKDSDNRYYYEGSGLTTGGLGGVLNARVNLGSSIYYHPKTKDFICVDDVNKELAKTSNNEKEVYTNNKELLNKGYIIIRPPKKGNILGCWTWNIDKFNNEKDRILIKNGKNGYSIVKKEFIEEEEVIFDGDNMTYNDEKDMPTKSFIDNISSSSGTQELKKLFETKIFNNPKPVELIKHLLTIGDDPDDLILDFFAGSGTTAQAIMELNRGDNGSRNFILVQWDELINQEKSKIAYDFCISNKLTNKRDGEKPFISDITIERVSRVGERIKRELNSIDIGYKVFSLVDKPKIVENKSTGQMEMSYTRSPQNTLYNMMCSKSVKLNAKIKEVVKDKLYIVDEAYYVLSFCDFTLLKDVEKNVYIDGYIVASGNKSIIEFIENIKSQVKDDDKVEVIY